MQSTVSDGRQSFTPRGATTIGRLIRDPRHSKAIPWTYRCVYSGRSPYLKTYTVQVVQGRLFGMSQSKAN
jgi:hypothetical protein